MFQFEKVDSFHLKTVISHFKFTFMENFGILLLRVAHVQCKNTVNNISSNVYTIDICLKLHANIRNNSQQCCVRLHGPKRLTAFNCTTTPNNMQHGVHTDATCNIQQCWELLANNCCVHLHGALRFNR